jgi:hypothetical protein
VIPQHRREAALVLRRLRASGDAPAADDVEGLRCVLPDSLPILRMHIRALAQSEHWEAMDALLSVGLLLRPHDRWLSLCRASRLLDMKQPQAAQAEIEAIVASRPMDLWARRLAARCARLQGAHASALEHSELAAILSHRAEDCEALISDLLCVGRAADAHAWAKTCGTVSRVLRAQVMLATGSLLSSLDVLREKDPEGRDRPGWLAERFLEIEIVERLGRRDELDAILNQHGDDGEVRLRASAGLLALGDMRRAICQAWSARNEGSLHGRAMMLIAVAATMLRRPRLARRTMNRLRRRGETFDVEWFTQVWRRALAGRVIADQMDFDLAGRDPTTMMLPRLVADAAGVFRRHAESAGSLGRVEACERWLGAESSTAMRRLAA